MRPQTIVERLDFVAKRIPGLKFTPPTQLKPGDDQFYGCFMSCDMFYIEIKVDQSHQSVKDVIISHGNMADGISCPVLRKVLADQDFETFAKHLSGLHSIYQINTNDKKVKQRAYPALTALESDLTIVYDFQRRRIPNCLDLVLKSPIGIMEPRRGGLPVKLTFFVTPYDLVDTTQRGLINLTVNNIVDKNLGLSATVEIEGSSAHKIQVKSLITQNNTSGLPSLFNAPFNSQNSERLPAQFVLKLSQPFPMLNTSINQIINEINEPATIKEFLSTAMTNSKESIVALIARQELDLNKGPFCRSVDTLKVTDKELCDLRKHVYSIKLPDQGHTYHILDNYLEKPDGVYVTKIPFTHPTSIPNILRVLRQQAMFNFVIGSCIRRNKLNQNGSTNSNPDEIIQSKMTTSTPAITTATTMPPPPPPPLPTSTTTTTTATSVTISQESNIFDVIPVSLNGVCISFEHPSRESLATLEIDLKELSCQMYALDRESVCSDEFATKVLQKCWSIPITLRSVLKKCNERRLALLEDSSKRRERELQELLTNNSTTQQGLQFKSHLKYQDNTTATTLQSKFNSLNENNKPNSRDLNSIAEFLSSKINHASTSDKTSDHQTSSSNSSNNNNNASDDASNRSNLLKKFSCKPKVKQNTTVKNQTGNKILSLMLKRQNSTTSIEDVPTMRAPLIKKVKTKSLSSNELGATQTGAGGGGGVKNSSNNESLATTKLIGADVARVGSKQGLTKQASANHPHNPNISLSLIRSPNKSQTSVMNAQSSSSIQVGLALTSNNTTTAPLTGSKLIDPPPHPPPSVIRGTKSLSQSNGSPANSGGGAAGKPRKSSIGAVLDRLVGGVTPEQQQNNLLAQHSSTLETVTESNNNNKGADSSRVAMIGAKSKSRPPGGDQFAIKQGSSGGGLKLTVTKTKPVSAAAASNPSSSSSAPGSVTASVSSPATASSSSTSQSTGNNPSSATPGNSGPTSSGGQANNTSSTTPSATTTTSSSSSSSNSAIANTTTSSTSGIGSSAGAGTTSSSSNASTTTTTTNNNNNNNNNMVTKSADVNKILDLGSSTAAIKYTIPKISKTQQASQSTNTNPANSSENSSSNDSQSDDNPSSSGNPASQPSSTTNKRTTSNPFNRTGITSRNPVSSSTHPPNNRTTSNPLAGASSRPSSTSNNDNHLLNRISSSNSNQLQNSMRQQLMANRTVNLTPQQALQQIPPPTLGQPQLITAPIQLQQQPSQPLPPTLTQAQPQQLQQIQPGQQLQHAVQRLMNPLMAQQQQIPNQPPMFTLSLPQQLQQQQQQIQPPTQNAFPNNTDLNLIAASQAALLNHQQQIQQQQIQQMQQHLLQQQQQQQQRLHQARVSSTSDSGSAVVDPSPNISQSALPSSTPSSPTECGQVDTIAPPPLIPIDSLHEAQPTPEDVADDGSDRLSIVDMNENIADNGSAAGTPKPSSVDSPMNIANQDSNAATSSTTNTAIATATTNSSSGSATAAAATVATSRSVVTEETAAGGGPTTAATASSSGASISSGSTGGVESNSADSFMACESASTPTTAPVSVGGGGASTSASSNDLVATSQSPQSECVSAATTSDVA